VINHHKLAQNLAGQAWLEGRMEHYGEAIALWARAGQEEERCLADLAALPEDRPRTRGIIGTSAAVMYFRGGRWHDARHRHVPCRHACPHREEREERVPEEQGTFAEWAILELMGHVRMGGRVSEVVLFGTAMGRIDVPTSDGGFTTQFFGGSSVYRLTPTTEELARAVAANNQPEPVHRWELQQLPAPDRRREPPYDDDEDYE
jgi:hypothetical protein